MALKKVGLVYTISRRSTVVVVLGTFDETNLRISKILRKSVKIHENHRFPSSAEIECEKKPSKKFTGCFHQFFHQILSTNFFQVGKKIKKKNSSK